MSDDQDPNLTIGPDAARKLGATTGARATQVLNAVVENKNQQADHATANPLRSALIGIGHFLVGALLIGFGVLCLKESVFWAVWVTLILSGLLVIAPNTIKTGINLAFAIAGDAFEKFKTAKKDA